MARAQGARAQMALAFETTYGTPPVGGFTKMPFASTSLGAEQPLLNSELLGYGRDPLAPIKDAVTADGDVVVPLDAEAFGFWLKAGFGDPTTTGTGPWTHEFQSRSWTLPSMAIETGMPEVPRYAMYSGCVLDQINWQMQRSGLLTATARLVAQGETVGTTTSAGTPAALELKRFGHFNGAITRNGSALGNVVSAEITYANNLDRIETIRSDGRIDGADPSIAALTGRIEVRFADSTLVTQAINGDPCEMEFAYVLPSGQSFTFTVHAVYLPRPRIEISGPQATEDVPAYGVVVSEQDAGQIERTNDAISRLGLIWRGLSNQLAVAAAPALEVVADAMAAIASRTGPLGIAIRGLFDNIGRLTTYAATFAAFLAGRWVAGMAAAALSAHGLATTLVVLRGALIRIGIGAVIVGAGELVYRFTRLVSGAGGFGERRRLSDQRVHRWDQ